jgi:hypothetical protein
MKTCKNRFIGLTVGCLPRLVIYKPLAVLLAILMLPSISWMEGGGAGTRPFQAHAQIAPLSVGCIPTTGPTTVGEAWHAICTAANGTPPYSWSITSGALPAGISGPSPTSGGFTSLGGTPTTAGGYSWVITVTDSTGNTVTEPFSGTINSTSNSCAATGNTIIRNYCGSGSSPLQNDLIQFESDAVNAYLGLHGLPASDAHVVYDFGRQDLRDGVRAAMYTTLLGIIVKPASSRSAHEQTLYNWFQDIVHHNEIQEYTLALQHFNSFRSDPCKFTLDQNIADEYKLKYDGTPFCFGGLQSSVFGVPVPAASYFKAYGLIHSYSAPVETDPNYTSIFADSAVSAGVIAGVSLAAGTLVSGIAGGIIANSAAAALAIFAQVGAEGSAAFETGLAISGAAVSTGAGVVLAVLAPVAIIFICVVAAVVAAIELFDNENQLKEINDLKNTLTQVTNNPPDLNSMITDSTAQGSFKLQNSVYSQTDPDVPATAALPTHQPGDLSFAITPQSTGVQQIAPTLQYQDWNGDQWTTQTWGGWFVQTCAQGTSSTTCHQADSITGDLRYVDWSGTKWTATRLGSTFVSTQATSNPGNQVCQTDTVAGVTIPGGTNPFDLSHCVSYSSTSIKMLDQNGQNITVSLNTLAAPSFVDPGPLTFSVGTPATVNIVAAGNPAPSIAWEAGGGNHFNFPISTGSSFPLSFDGTLLALPETFTLTLKASNNLGSVTQSFPVNLVNVLNIIAPATLTGTAGTPMNFKVVGTGIPTPKLSYNGFALPGLTFKDNGDGTGSLSGIYTGTTLVEQCLAGNCGGFVASNLFGTKTQPVSINFTASPDALPTPGSVTFTAGVQNSVLLSSFGAITPVSWLFFGFIPPWLSLTDHGNGNATLSGMPPLGTSGTFRPFLAPHALGSGCNCAPQFPVVVVNTPVFTSPNAATFTVGTHGSFSVSASEGSITTSDTLPQGLALAAGNPASIFGNPAVGTGGQYGIKLNVSSPDGSATQDLTVNVNEATQFTSPGLVVLFAGQPASFAVTTTGFPSVSMHAVAANSGPPNPSQGDGTLFTVSGLPNSFQASNQNPLGLATGTLTISGTPQAGDVGTHKVQITAQNGVGAPAGQTLTLVVFPNNPAAGVNLVSSSVLSRNANHDVVETVVVANNGSTAAQDVAITSAKIGGVAGVISPKAVASIAPQSTATFTAIFPASSLGGPGTLSVMTLSGTYSGGTFSNAGRIVLP